MINDELYYMQKKNYTGRNIIIQHDKLSGHYNQALSTQYQEQRMTRDGDRAAI
jgi:hypothetical protein